MSENSKFRDYNKYEVWSILLQNQAALNIPFVRMFDSNLEVKRGLSFYDGENEIDLEIVMLFYCDKSLIKTKNNLLNGDHELLLTVNGITHHSKYYEVEELIESLIKEGPITEEEKSLSRKLTPLLSLDKKLISDFFGIKTTK